MTPKEQDQLIALASECDPTIIDELMQKLSERLGSEIVAKATRKAQPALQGDSEKPRFRQVAEFLRFVGETPPQLVDTLLPEKALVLVTGKPKAGKTFLAMDIASAVAEGKPVFGSFTVNRPGPIGIVGMEDGQNEIANRLKFRGLREDSDDIPIHICAERFRLSDPRNMDILEGMITAFSPTLLVIDTAREALGVADWNNAAQVSDAVRPLRDFARKHCTIVLVAHNKKGAFDHDEGDEISGSNALTSSVDGWISANKVEVQANGNRRLFLAVVGRGGMEGKPVVEMDTTNTHFRLVPPEELGGEAMMSELATKRKRWEPYLTALDNMPSKMGTVNTLVDAVGASRPTVQRIVKELLDAREIIEVDGASKVDSAGRPAAQYRRNLF